MWEEGEVRVVAARQYGLVNRRQLLRMEVTDEEISWRIAIGRLEILHPGVYYLDCTPLTWKTEVLAAVMAAGPDAIASHRCAGVLWEMDAIYGRMIEVTVPYSESPEPKGVVLHRTRRPNPRAELAEIPVSPPEKALLDMAANLPDRTLWKAARSAVHRGTTNIRRMDEAIGIYGGRGVGGTRRMRRIIQLVADDKSGSPAEIDLKDMVFNAPVPIPVQQLRVPLPSRENAYPDFSWPDRMRIVEVDGFGAHGSPEQQQRDLRRQNQLLDLGWEIRRFTATEVRDEPERVRAELIRFVNKPFREDLSVQSTD
jgi:hypothetical protein